MQQRKLEFSKVVRLKSEGGREYNLRRMMLPIDGDTANVLEPCGSDKFLAGTERGQVYLFSLYKNKVLGTSTLEEWISCVSNYGKYIWSAGINRTIHCHHMKTGSLTSVFKGDSSLQKYPELGITIEVTKNRSFFIYNCGDLKFKLVSYRSRKLIKTFNVAESLSGNLCFSGLSNSEKLPRSYFVSAHRTLIFIAISRYNPHIIIYDYSKNKVVTFESLHPKLDPAAQKPVSMFLIKAFLDDFSIFIYQFKGLSKNGAISTFYTAIRPVTGKEDSEFEVHRAKALPSKPLLTACTRGSNLHQKPDGYET